MNYFKKKYLSIVLLIVVGTGLIIYTEIMDKLSYKEEIHNKLGIEAFLVSQVKDTNLLIAYTNNGPYIVDKGFHVLINGSINSIDTGRNLIAENIEKNKDELNRIILLQKVLNKDDKDTAQSIKTKDEIVARQRNHQSPVKNPTLTPEQMMLLRKQIENKVADQYPAAKEFIKDVKSQNREENSNKNTSQDEVSVKNHPVIGDPVSNVQNKQKADSTVSSLNNMLLRMDPEVRKEKGPLVSATVLPDIPDKYLVVFENDKNVPYKGTLTVASDYTCHFCKYLHSIVPELNAEGVKVRYMPYSRGRIFDVSAEQQPRSIDELIALDKTAPMNLLGMNNARALCSSDRGKAFDQLFGLGEIVHAPTITKQCEAITRQFQVLGDMYFTSQTPYMVWGDHTTPNAERGYIAGVKSGYDRSINDLLKRLQK